MNHVAFVASLALLTGCASQNAHMAALDEEATEGVLQIQAREHGQLDFDLDSGLHLCEWGEQVHVLRDASARDRIHIGWNGGRYQLDRDPSFSGLPRFEDRTNGLVWIDLPWKGLLLDGKTQKPLANECKTA